MDSIYGINVKNKFELFIDEDEDPLEILAQQESAKKEQDKKKKDDKTKKNKNAKKQVLKAENKNKPVEEPVKPVKEEKVNAPKQPERPRTGRQNRDNREPREDPRPPRRRDENFNPENRERVEKPPTFSTERSETGGGGFGQREGGPRGEGGFGRGRGGRGRGGRGRSERGRGGFGGRREFERHSGSDKTGVKPVEKKDGSGAHNWGTVKDDIDMPPPKMDYWRDPKEQMKDVQEETQDWNAQPEDTENKDPNESTESAPAEEPEEEGPKQMTLEEWKRMEEAKRVKSDFKLRKPNEGVDISQWKGARAYRKSEGDEDESDEEETDEEEEDEDEARQKKLVQEIRITFNDSPRRGRGGRRPRGPRGGRMGGARGGDRRSGNVAPKFDDENDFPSLIKSAA